MKNTIKLIVILLTVLLISGCADKASDRIKIVSTVFPAYDAVNSITKGEEVNNILLIKPGSDLHSYDPTPKDLIDIKTSDIFIYVGGESEEWVEDIISEIDTSKTKVIKMMDLVDLKEEEIVDGMEEDSEGEEIEMDEHIWTSPVNMKTIVNSVYKAIYEIDTNSLYTDNYNKYNEKLEKLDSDFRNIVNTSIRKEVIFADRFPLLYFVKEYGLSYYAAFKGCAENTEASSKTISFLIDKVREDKIPYIFTIELSNKKIANIISEETGTQIFEFNSLHNISKEDFENGETYISLMNKNLEYLKKALN